MFTLSVYTIMLGAMLYTIYAFDMNIMRFFTQLLTLHVKKVSSRKTRFSHTMALLLQQLLVIWTQTFIFAQNYTHSPANGSLHLLISLTSHCMFVIGSHSFGTTSTSFVYASFTISIILLAVSVAYGKKFFNSRNVCQCIHSIHRITTVLLLYDFYKTHMLNALKFQWMTSVTFQSLIRLDLVSYVLQIVNAITISSFSSRVNE